MSGARAILAALACIAAAGSSTTLLHPDSRITRPSSVLFWTEAGETFRVDSDGRVFVRGKAITEDPEIYRLMKRWLAGQCRGEVQR